MSGHGKSKVLSTSSESSNGNGAESSSEKSRKNSSSSEDVSEVVATKSKGSVSQKDKQIKQARKSSEGYAESDEVYSNASDDGVKVITKSAKSLALDLDKGNKSGSVVPGSQKEPHQKGKKTKKIKKSSDGYSASAEVDSNTSDKSVKAVDQSLDLPKSKKPSRSVASNSKREGNLKKNADPSAPVKEKKQSKKEKKKKYKKRLIIGDGNFSYSRALLGKHPEIASALTVTEIMSPESLRETYSKKESLESGYVNFEENLRVITQAGARTFFGVDATKINKTITARHERIHFNFPYVPNESGDIHAMARNTCNLVSAFFKSAGSIQDVGDRIHMALPKIPNDPSKEAWHQNTKYDIVNAARNGRYTLVARRKFSNDGGKSERYPGYRHVKTGASASAPTAEEGREYVFKKIGQSEEYKSPTKKVSDGGWQRTILGLSTDSDSSDYLAPDSDQSSLSDEEFIGKLKIK